jgi:selenocysteine lyase/cysteine desulfurase
MIDRRSFLKQTGAALGLAGCARVSTLPPAAHASSERWKALRAQFPLDPSYIHFASFLLSAHCTPVREAVARFRDRLDAMPAYVMDYEREEVWQHEDEVRNWAGKYLNVQPGQIALTGSTTEGLSLIYAGLQLEPQQEILTTVHEHYSAYTAMDFRTAKDGTRVRRIELFQDPASVSRDRLLETIDQSIRPETRVLGMTWVHSGSGVKLPIGEIGALVQQHNQRRGERDRIIFCVDGVHGLGVEDVQFADLDCDFFIAGTHKWMFGPRGTGIIVSRWSELKYVTPTVPTFSRDDNFGTMFSPGGYLAFEHRWALAEAFKLHLALGKAAVQARIHTLNRYLKERLRELPRVQLVTPLDPALSAGFTFFRVGDDGEEPLSKHLNEQRVLVDAVDRDVGPVVRMAPGLLNDESEIDRVVALVRERLA